MKFRVGRAIASTMAIAAATLMATAVNASADIPPGIDWDHTWSQSGVRVYVEEHGDIISVCDTKANGHAAYVRVVDRQYTTYKASGGAGTCKTHDAGDGGVYNLREHYSIGVYYRGDGRDWDYHGYVNDH